jgi:hypothetical protein
MMMPSVQHANQHTVYPAIRWNATWKLRNVWVILRSCAQAVLINTTFQPTVKDVLRTFQNAKPILMDYAHHAKALITYPQINWPALWILNSASLTMDFPNAQPVKIFIIYPQIVLLVIEIYSIATFIPMQNAKHVQATTIPLSVNYYATKILLNAKHMKTNFVQNVPTNFIFHSTSFFAMPTLHTVRFIRTKNVLNATQLIIFPKIIKFVMKITLKNVKHMKTKFAQNVPTNFIFPLTNFFVMLISHTVRFMRIKNVQNAMQRTIFLKT